MDPQKLAAWWPTAEPTLARRARPAKGGEFRSDPVAEAHTLHKVRGRIATYSHAKVRELHLEHGVEPELIAERFGITTGAVQAILRGPR